MPPLEETDKKETLTLKTRRPKEPPVEAKRVLLTGGTGKRETVRLKPRPRQKEPPGALVARSSITAGSSILDETRGSLKSPSSRQQSAAVATQVVAKQPKKIINPYYALDKYSNGNGSEERSRGEESPSQMHSTPATAATDPMEDKEDPPDLSAPFDEVLDRRDRSWEKNFIGKSALFVLCTHFSLSEVYNKITQPWV